MPEFGLSDVRTITIQTRMMISLNAINPNCFMVSKIADMNPKGLLKLTFKQDDYNKKRDDSILMICDYYDDSGDITIDAPTPIESETKRSQILVDDVAVEKVELHTGATTYFSVEFSDEGIDAQWKISLVGDDANKEEIEKLMVMNQINAALISIRPGKSTKVKGRKFTLSVYNADGDYYSSIELEVVD